MSMSDVADIKIDAHLWLYVCIKKYKFINVFVWLISLFQLHISRRQLKKIMVNILRFNKNILLALCSQETFYIYPVLKVATVSAKKSAFSKNYSVFQMAVMSTLAFKDLFSSSVNKFVKGKFAVLASRNIFNLTLKGVVFFKFINTCFKLASFFTQHK